MTTQRKLYAEDGENSSPGEAEGRSPMHAAARRYAQWGLPIFQSEPLDKVPLRQLGPAEATTDLAQIDAWFTEEPDAGICGLFSDLVTIIVEPGAAPEWHEQLRAIKTREHESPRGSVHYLVKVPNGEKFANGLVLDESVRVCSNPGYIMLPPSMIEVDGEVREYRMRTKVLPKPAPKWLLQKLREAPVPPKPDFTNPLSYNEWWEVPDLEMVVEKIVPAKKLVLVWGDTGCGKTYFLAELAVKIAWRMPVYGTFPVNLPRRGGVVIIFAGEDAAELVKSRLTALAVKYNRSLEGRVFVSGVALPLDSEEALKMLIQKVREIKERTGREVDAIFNDTLGRSLGSLDPNSGEVAQFFSQTMEGLVEEFGCPVVCTAHEPKSGGSIAGSKIFMNNAPVTPHVEGRFNRDHRLTGFTVTFWPKYRIGKTPPRFAVVAEEVTLPQPVNGSATDIVFNMSEEQPGSQDAEERDASVSICLEVLGEFGEPGAGRGAWQKACEARGVSRWMFDESLADLLKTGRVRKGQKQRDPYRVSPLH